MRILPLVVGALIVSAGFQSGAHSHGDCDSHAGCQLCLFATHSHAPLAPSILLAFELIADPTPVPQGPTSPPAQAGRPSIQLRAPPAV